MGSKVEKKSAREQWVTFLQAVSHNWYINAAQFNAKCREVCDTPPKGEKAYMKAAARVKHTCPRCAGTGKFITHTVNGVPRGPGGDCFRCEGKGYQTVADAVRNLNYDMYGYNYQDAV